MPNSTMFVNYQNIDPNYVPNNRPVSVVEEDPLIEDLSTPEVVRNLLNEKPFYRCVPGDKLKFSISGTIIDDQGLSVNVSTYLTSKTIVFSLYNVWSDKVYSATVNGATTPIITIGNSVKPGIYSCELNLQDGDAILTKLLNRNEVNIEVI